MRSVCVGLLVWLSVCACGGPGPISPAQQELDQKHCSNNSECASGFCRAGRCG